MKNEELKPCPFCGCEATSYQSGWGDSDYDVGCFNGECAVEPHAWAETEEEAAIKWNTRAPIKYPMIEALSAERDAALVALELSATALRLAEELYQVGLIGAPDGLPTRVVYARQAALAALKSVGGAG